MIPARENFALLPAWTPPLMYALALLAAACFLAGCLRLARRIDLREAWRIAPGSSREKMARLLTYGLLQRRIASRFNGLLHAALVAGFVLLLLATTLVFVDQDLLRPFGRRLLTGNIYAAFSLGANAAGLLVVVAGGALLAWVVAREKPADERVRRNLTTTLGALLVLGVTGFALEAVRLALRPTGAEPWRFAGAWLADPLRGHVTAKLYTALWWSHAVLAFGFIAALPYTALSHVLATPLNIALAPPEPAGALSKPFDLAALMASGQFDVKPGIARAADLTAADRAALLACTSCGRCEEVCPSALSGASLSPRILVRELRDRLNGRAQEDLLATPLASQAWACNTCGGCAAVCPAHVRPYELAVGIRRALLAEGRADGRQAQMLAGLERAGNPYGMPAADRESLSDLLGAPTLAQAGQAEWLYWVGCAGVYDARVRRVVEATAGLLRRAGVKFAVTGAEVACCGEAARRMGEEGRFQMLALDNLVALEQYGVRRIVTHCPHCYNTLRNEYAQLGGRLDVVHHTELLAELAEQRKLPRSMDGERVTLHDGCSLGRLNGIYEAPRWALHSAGARLVEMPRSRRTALCCGGGGGAYWYDVERSVPPARLRVEEAVAMGAGIIATECPFCLKMLGDAAAESVKVLDVAELLAGVD